jgi:8-oxo-dGTP pyrophosphatase MutT (NUDIX family)
LRLLAQHPEGVDPSRPWEDLNISVRQDSRIFKQVVTRRKSPHTEREHEFYRLEGPDWVNVIALTEGLELLAVEQFRHGIDQATLEIPGGCCDPGEDVLISAQRELEEETGHVSEQWIPLGSCTPNPATQANRCHSFLALDCKPAGALKLDLSEELRLWACSWKDWEERLYSGEIHHALVLTAFLKLQLWEGWAELRARL